jgi:indolepyruvate ferredoxin oxidoreductase beta subunit
MESKKVVMVAVGGQGNILSARLLGEACMLLNIPVVVSEIHGMAQRGGSVISQVRIGEKVYSPLIAVGQTDILLSFEKLEALRFAHFLAPDGIAMVNNQEIRPVTVSSGQSRWPEDLDARLKNTFPRLELIPALDIARDLGNVRVVNVVMIGALSNHFDVEDAIWRESIRALVKPQYLDFNLKAFDAGKRAGSAVRV